MATLSHLWRPTPNRTNTYDCDMTVVLPRGSTSRYQVRYVGKQRFRVIVNGSQMASTWKTVEDARGCAERYAAAAMRGNGDPVPASSDVVVLGSQALPPGDYRAIPNDVYDRETIELREIMNEVHAATCYVMEHGKLEIGTPQSKRLIETVRRLKVLAKTDPKMPKDYPI